MTAQKPVLGKGLASLLPAAMPMGTAALEVATSASQEIPAPLVEPATPAAKEVLNKDRHPGISLAHVGDIVENQYQPRKQFDDRAIQELSDSIKTNGVIQPLIVRKTSGGYELIAGERRLRAAKKAGLTYVPIVIRKSTDKESLELALVENIQRQDLNCVDEARAYSQLAEEFVLTQEEIAKRVGKERATVANSLRLLKLPDAVLEDLKSGALSSGHGKALLGLDDNDLRLQARMEIHDRKLSVRETEHLVQHLNDKKTQSVVVGEKTGESASEARDRLEAICQDLTRQWFAKVKIVGTPTKGKFTIQFGTREEFERILSTLQQHQKGTSA